MTVFEPFFGTLWLSFWHLFLVCSAILFFNDFRYLLVSVLGSLGTSKVMILLGTSLKNHKNYEISGNSLPELFRAPIFDGFSKNFQVAFRSFCTLDFRIGFWSIFERFWAPKRQLPGVNNKRARPIRLREALAAVFGPRFWIF